MIVGQRAQRVVEIHTSLLQFVGRQVIMAHLIYLRFQVVGGNALSQSHIAKVAVVTHPIVATIPGYLGQCRHRYQHLQVVQSGIQGDILVDTANSECQIATLIIIHLLTNHVATQFLGYRLRNHAVVRLTERFLWITCQNTVGKHIEETTIGKEEIGTYALIVFGNQWQVPTKACIAGSGLNLRAVALQAVSDSTRCL